MDVGLLFKAGFQTQIAFWSFQQHRWSRLWRQINDVKKQGAKNSTHTNSSERPISILIP